MPAEVPTATALVAVAAFLVCLLLLPFLLLAAAPFLVAKLAFGRRAPAVRRGGYYAVR